MRQYTLQIEAPPPDRVGFTSELNPEQRRVVEAGPGPMLVIAGAGSGKTRTLTYRAARLVQQGVAADRILLLTFTNKAAREMVERVGRLVPRDARHIWAGTFHAIAHRVLRQHADRLGYAHNYGILDPQEARDLMDVVVAEHAGDLTARRFPKREVLLSMLSSAVNTNRALRDVVNADCPRFVEQLDAIDRVLTAYLGQKVEMNVMDYDDLLVNWRMLLEDHGDVRRQLSERFRHVLVDEYQDTNRLQAAIVELLAGPETSVVAVGDDCQSIYRFRGADVHNILDFPQRFPGTRVHRLETNYRSTPEILAVANASIRHNTMRFDKTLRAARDAHERPALVTLADEQQQAAFVAQRCLELREQGVELSKQAVLYRAHYQSMDLQIELQKRGIPYTVRSGLRFFEQAHVRDVLAHLRILANPLDRLAWTRVLKLQDGIGARQAARIYTMLSSGGDAWAALEADVPGGHLPGPASRGYEALRGLMLALGHPQLAGDPGGMLERILDGGYSEWLKRHQTDAADREDDIRQLSHFAGQFADCQSFLEELVLSESVSVEAVESGGEPDERLVLTTVHQAKGLEWDAVFLLHLADGHFPLRRALNDPEDTEEARRLFYVAVTRARTQLHLCYPQWGRDRERRMVMQRPSRFLAELPHTREDLLETWRVDEQASGSL